MIEFAGLTPGGVVQMAGAALLTLAVSTWMQRRGTRSPAAPLHSEMMAEYQRASPPPLPVMQAPIEPLASANDDRVPPTIARMAEQRQAKRIYRPEVAAIRFLEFMRERGHTGWFASEHIDDCWAWFCDLHNVVQTDGVLIRAELAAMPACRHGQRRLKTPEFAAVREALGRDRAYVFYIPPSTQPLPCRITSGATAGGGGSNQGDGRKSSGKRPAQPQKRVLPTTFSDGPDWHLDARRAA